MVIVLAVASIAMSPLARAQSTPVSPGVTSTLTPTTVPGSAAAAVAPGTSAGSIVPPGTMVPPAPGADGPIVRVAGTPAPQPDSEVKTPPSTTEIPPVVPLNQQPEPELAEPPATIPNVYDQAADIYNYQGQQPPAELQQQLESLQQFMEEGDNTTSVGMVVREAHRKIDGGGEIAGLLVVSVMPESPAAKAGLRGMRSGAHSVLEGAAVAASLFFPPAIMAVALVDGSRVGESYDMIIAVDSVRVTNFLDFNDRMRQVEPGDIIYLTVVRNGHRLQVPVKVPDASAASTVAKPGATTAAIVAPAAPPHTPAARIQ
jgi:hypothetical protein